MPTIRVAIAGATGYTGEELIRLLSQHPHVQLTHLAASAKWDRPVPVSSVYPHLSVGSSLSIQSLDPAQLVSADAVFLALPHGYAMELAPPLLEQGVHVIDLSGDFRLKDASLYPAWYHRPHTHPELLGDGRVVYGLSEYAREALPAAKLVANPGCYATSILLGLLPLAQAGLLADDRVLVDAKSGKSGAGRKTEPDGLEDNLRPYKVHAHQHMPEISQTVQQLTGMSLKLGFTPQVLPTVRGLVSMLYLTSDADERRVASAFEQAYPAATTPFVRLRGQQLPQLKDPVMTNYCDIGWTVNPELRLVTVVSAIDNLTKGAAGQAVQNLNLMFGWPETTGLS